MILFVTLNPAIDFTVYGRSFEPRRTNRGRDAAPDPGGKGNNAARIASLLGAKTAVSGFLGGFTGDFIASELEREGIRARFHPIRGLTRITVAFVEEEGTHAETKIVPQGPEISSGEREGFLRRFEKILKGGKPKAVALCGSLPAGLPEDFYAVLIDIAKNHGVPAILDSSGKALEQGLRGDPFMIKPNLDEAAELVGSRDEDTIYAAMRELARRTGVVALSLGSRGAAFFTSTRALRVSVAEGGEGAGPINAVGAGDAFVGGFCASLDLHGFDEERAFAWAVAAGYCTAHSQGMLWPADAFSRALDRVIVEEIPA